MRPPPPPPPQPLPLPPSADSVPVPAIGEPLSQMLPPEPPPPIPDAAAVTSAVIVPFTVSVPDTMIFTMPPPSPPPVLPPPDPMLAVSVLEPYVVPPFDQHTPYRPASP